jgi:hypothetical protein
MTQPTSRSVTNRNTAFASIARSVIPIGKGRSHAVAGFDRRIIYHKKFGA